MQSNERGILLLLILGIFVNYQACTPLETQAPEANLRATSFGNNLHESYSTWPNESTTVLNSNKISGPVLTGDIDMDGRLERIFISRSEDLEAPLNMVRIVDDQTLKEVANYYDNLNQPGLEQKLAVEQGSGPSNVLFVNQDGKKLTALQFRSGRLTPSWTAQLPGTVNSQPQSRSQNEDFGVKIEKPQSIYTIDQYRISTSSNEAPVVEMMDDTPAKVETPVAEKEVTTSPQRSPASIPAQSATLPYNGRYFGVLQTGSQGNIPIKGINGTGFRFKARHTGVLEAVSVHVKAMTYKSVPKCTETNCYGGGNGGNLQAAIYADNGKGFPDLSKKLAVTNKIVSVIKTWGEQDRTRAFKFSSAINISQNTMYHILFSNDDSKSGWSSINWQFSYANPITIGEPVSDYWSNEVVLTGTSISARHQPSFLLSLKIDNKAVQWGSLDLMARPGVIDDPAKNDTVRSICGKNSIRQRFKPGRDMVATKVVLPLAYFGSGAGNLVLRITDESGKIIGNQAEATFTKGGAVNVGGKYTNIFTDKATSGKYVLRYKSAAFSAPVSLQANKVYYLEAQNSSSALCYFLMANENGFRDGYDSIQGAEAWNDQAEYSTGEAWNLMYIWGKARPAMEWPMALQLE